MKKPPTYASAAFLEKRALVDIDKDAGSTLLFAPITMMILMHDIGVMGVVIIPVTIVIMRPRIVMPIVGKCAACGRLRKRCDSRQQQ